MVLDDLDQSFFTREANAWLVRTVLGIGIILLAKGIRVRHRAIASRPRRRRQLALGGLGAVFLLAASAPSVSAQIGPIPLPGLPSLDPADWAVKGVQAILKFFFGTSMEEISSVFVNLLPAVPHSPTRRASRN